MNWEDDGGTRREMDWAAKVFLIGKQVDHIPEEALPYFQTPEEKLKADIWRRRINRLFPDINKIIGAMPPRQREAIELFFGLKEKPSKVVVGDLMGLHRSTVSRHISRGIRKIRTELGYLGCA